MRIIGGEYKGRVLLEFKGKDVRPTSDMTRESLFNIIRNGVSDSSFLDLFCGTGAVGIEAYSRGAKRVVLNDNSKDSLSIVKKNLEKLKIEEITVSFSDALGYLERNTEKFDYIFIDAPYKSGLGEKALPLCVGSLSENGTVIFENEKPFSEEVSGLIKTDERKYGRAVLTFFKPKKD